jgi:hypothetical protein
MFDIAKHEDDSLQLAMATAFREDFGEKFDAAMAAGEPEFTIEKKVFDHWLHGRGFVDGNFLRVPSPDDRIPWNAWVVERNGKRTCLNNAARIGQHGQPPYRIDNDKGDPAHYHVRLLSGMVLCTYDNAVDMVKSLILNKDASIGKMFTMLQPDIDALPLEQRVMLSVQKKQFSRTAARIALALEQLQADVAESFCDMQTAIASSAARPALTHQVDATE